MKKFLIAILTFCSIIVMGQTGVPTQKAYDYYIGDSTGITVPITNHGKVYHYHGRYWAWNGTEWKRISLDGDTPALTDGNGTTFNTNKIDLGGTATQDIYIDPSSPAAVTFNLGAFTRFGGVAATADFISLQSYEDPTIRSNTFNMGTGVIRLQDNETASSPSTSEVIFDHNGFSYSDYFAGMNVSNPYWLPNKSYVDSLTNTATYYSGSSPTTRTVENFPIGTNISTKTISELIQNIYAPYIAPVFTSFSISGQSTTVEVGTTLSGSKTFTWGITLNSGTVATIDLYDNTASSTLLSGTTNDGSQAQTITTIQLNSNGATQSWKGIGHDTGSSPSNFNSSNFIVTGRYLRFFGPVAASPTNSATVRAISAGTFHTGATVFNLTTGTSLTKFVCALPPSVTISNVIDLDALNADITSQYILTGTISVTDAGGTSRSYNIYEMNVAVPYTTTHRHQITTAN